MTFRDFAPPGQKNNAGCLYLPGRPFEKVVESVVKERDTNRNPLFQVLLSLQNTPVIPNLNLGELSLSQKLRMIFF